MHVKTDSEATSFAPSSPDHNRRPMYFVQSPSRCSHEAEKIGMSSFLSTPAPSSPADSPQLYQTYVVNHSRESSTSRLSSKLSPNDVGLRGGGYSNGGVGNWKLYGDMGEEEGLLEDEEDSGKGASLRCYILSFVVGFVLLFSLFALILWGASKPLKPKIAMRSIKFERFVVQAGSDDTGVSTDMITVNATVRFTFRNTANFFGVHVSSTPLTLSYSLLSIGSGDLEEFYQRRNGARNVSVIVIGNKIPLYGNGAHLVTPNGLTTVPVPLNLDFTIRSKAYVLGKLVKTRFIKKIECSVAFDARKLNVAIPLSKYCTYD